MLRSTAGVFDPAALTGAGACRFRVAALGYLLEKYSPAQQAELHIESAVGSAFDTPFPWLDRMASLAIGGSLSFSATQVAPLPPPPAPSPATVRPPRHDVLEHPQLQRLCRCGSLPGCGENRASTPRLAQHMRRAM